MPNHFCPTPECAASGHNPPMNLLWTCRHGESGPHYYGLAEEPDYDGGPVIDIAISCDEWE